ncbi:iron ABC transporter permease [Pseudoalteromonas tunicata]|uniref:FecCD family ABC transporter permease n=1 Tax=Pseudoalteromonas tunicata TaxID=314281 RepID=UPI00273DB1CF|nr:iron ABC transporter permease [Pseudoalteromonas tunicata]MDP5213367.1 iron ABC transporter permease [Pseudoalteromonas tunicata]
MTTISAQFRTKKSAIANYSITLLLSLAILLLLFVAALLFGAVNLSPVEIFNTIKYPHTNMVHTAIIWEIRLPRALLAMLAGINFALAGVILQTVIRNPLADPSLIGANGGASLAIVICLLLGDYIQVHFFPEQKQLISLSWLPIIALIGALAATFLVLKLSWKSQLQTSQLALNGVAVGATLNALVMWCVLAWGGNRTETSIIWLAGSLYARDFTHLQLLLPWTLCALSAFFILQKHLNVMQLDERSATSLGLNIKLWRLVFIFIAACFCASALAITGPLGFIGLIVPHIARTILKNTLFATSLKHISLLSLLIGAALTLAADIVSRTLIAPLEIPTGTLTTLIGIPILLIILRKQG